MAGGNGSDDDWSDDDWSDALEEEFPRAPVADDEATVVCPYCGERVDIAVDAGGGSHQEYIEDCAVCCRPWQVHVQYDDEGNATVSVDQSQ